MSQVIIVSNRLPVSVKKENGKLEFYPSVGGLATGLSSYANDRRNTWIGWSGIASDELTDADKQAIVAELAQHNCNPVFLSQRQIDDFYNGYSNRVLWPLFHNMGRQPRENDTRRRWWQAYRSVNQLFAEVALNLSESDGRIWVHDYQLMLVPALLRAARTDISIGYFLHIPFPDSPTFQRLPENKKLLTGLLGADVVGFHTPDYVANFIDSCQLIGVDVASDNQLIVGTRAVRAADFPMGIDYEKYATAGRSKAVRLAVRKYRRRYRRLKVIVAVDRLDPSKGLIERMQAYQTLLERYPRLRGKVVFSLVAAPSRTDVPAYRTLAKRLAVLVERINTTYGTKRWQPVDYMNTTVPFEEVTALFQIADVAFIAPLRDGMNLVAKEFVASNRKNGVLILSETAGAASELREALIVNPRQPETLVYALYQALTLRRRAFRRRLQRMRRHLSVNTVQYWAKDFVENLQKPIPGTPQLRTWTLKGHWEKTVLTDYRQAKQRLLLLDYDGTLVPFSEDYLDARPPSRLLEQLEQLSADPANIVVLVSGRAAVDLERWFGKLSVNLVAEHGATVKRVGNKRWQTIERAEAGWQKTIRPLLQKYSDLTPQARVETKPHTLVWHYRAAPPYYAQKYAVVIKKVLKPLLRQHSLQLYQGNKILEIKNPAINKGAAVERWLKKQPDFVLAIGDDYTDEDLFQTLPESAYTVKVGSGRTNARFRLADDKAVGRLLRKLNK
jgi:trehalose 6-phosphate synthase/phosphatase